MSNVPVHSSHEEAAGFPGVSKDDLNANKGKDGVLGRARPHLSAQAWLGEAAQPGRLPDTGEIALGPELARMVQSQS